MQNFKVYPLLLAVNILLKVRLIQLVLFDFIFSLFIWTHIDNLFIIYLYIIYANGRIEFFCTTSHQFISKVFKYILCINAFTRNSFLNPLKNVLQPFFEIKYQIIIS